MSKPDALTALGEMLGDRLSRSKSDLDLHGRNETYFPFLPPDAVAYPETTDEVAQIVRICAAHGVPLIGWGRGTSLEGHALALQGGVTIDFSRMNRVLKVNSEDMDVVVQPGLTREDLNRELRATGLFFPVDPGANASLGGMASTRASGTTAVRYGTMRDNVLALEVVLPDGRVIRTGTRARKSSAGYDLTGLFVGSEGTLGLITELTLRLHGQPEAISAAVCAFDEIGAAVDTVIQTIQLGIPMARIEFVDAATAAAFNAYASADMPEKPHLMVEFHGSAAGVAEQAESFGEVVAENGGEGFKWSSRPEDRNALWTMRHNAYYACLGLRPGATALVTDMCVPISRLAEAVEETRADIAQASIPGPILGHVGDGNFHAILLVEPDNAAELAEAKALAHRMVERALRMGGTVTGEHGIGMGKLDYMEEEHGAAWDVMGQIKRALDPMTLMNPGKMVRAN
ncbi:FAD-binding protein [Rhodovulum sulfidophilum]|uniref:FAD-binding oxidoreductase n=1 Tax=Rhodovulum sulfidophilum TaxID=35806 RepID=UPI000951BA0A|nr:FAD-linked oxidase C-terminal domain-containing protein [Rhodovulum sulfidophilum]MBL3554229.1 FAD-binding protein [Rhodovulum sulfidophilum]MBL3594927.1 FAD-binding protein [Rhodovulum sulfidophilum]MCE8439215.1 FAD-binding protein [Rhodovulum sulfidophilum]OLS47993.1 2-hydroxy-acid oxidase [Rhodovulum sulfidophilum]